MLNEHLVETLFHHFKEHQHVISALIADSSSDILALASTAARVLQNGGTIFWCGNGGSAADCQHLAAELVGRFKFDRKPLSSISLSTDTSVLTCIANDYDFKEIFSRQIKALGKPGDLLVGISTSGNSENVLAALASAKLCGLTTAALLGNDGGNAKFLTDIPIIVSSDSTARIQEAHILIGHCLCVLIEKDMGFQ
jgi:D-sedoheptulose 7-phosphate isomerase